MNLQKQKASFLKIVLRCFDRLSMTANTKRFDARFARAIIQIIRI